MKNFDEEIQKNSIWCTKAPMKKTDGDYMLSFATEEVHHSQISFFIFLKYIWPKSFVKNEKQPELTPEEI